MHTNTNVHIRAAQDQCISMTQMLVFSLTMMLLCVKKPINAPFHAVVPQHGKMLKHCLSVLLTYPLRLLIHPFIPLSIGGVAVVSSSTWLAYVEWFIYYKYNPLLLIM